MSSINSSKIVRVADYFQEQIPFTQWTYHYELIVPGCAPLIITDVAILAMREWINDCQWGDISDESKLTDFQVIQGVDDNVDGGLSEFIHNMC